MTDETLLARIVELAAIEKQAKADAEPLRAEMLRRQLESGEVTFASGGWESSLSKEPITLSWLKRQHGYEVQDLPDGIVTEKIVPDLNVPALLAWLGTEHEPAAPTYTIRIKRKKD